MDLIDRDLLDAVLDQPKSKQYLGDDSTPLVSLYSDDEFRRRFRLSNNSFAILLVTLEKIYVSSSNNREHPISLETKLMAFLRILAENTFQLANADHFSVSQASVSRFFHEILDLLFEMRNEFIYWPDKNECESVSRRFYVETGHCG